MTPDPRADRDPLAEPVAIADSRDHFQAGMHRMREAFTAVRQGRMTWEQGNDEFFDGYQQAKVAFAAVALMREVRAAQQRGATS